MTTDITMQENSANGKSAAYNQEYNTHWLLQIVHTIEHIVQFPSGDQWTSSKHKTYTNPDTTIRLSLSDPTWL